MRTKFRISRFLFTGFFYAWIVETIVFQIIDGWHWKAISPAEKLVDNILGYVAFAAFIFLILSVYDWMEIVTDRSMTITLDKPEATK